MDDYKTEAIDQEAFRRHANKSRISFPQCPSCHTNNPTMLVHDSGTAALGLTYSTNNAPYPSAFEVVAVECAHCGFLYLYNRAAVARGAR